MPIRLPLASLTTALLALSDVAWKLLTEVDDHDALRFPETATLGVVTFAATAPVGKVAAAWSLAVTGLVGVFGNGKFSPSRRSGSGGSPVPSASESDRPLRKGRELEHYPAPRIAVPDVDAAATGVAAATRSSSGRESASLDRLKVSVLLDVGFQNSALVSAAAAAYSAGISRASVPRGSSSPSMSLLRKPNGSRREGRRTPRR